MRLNRWLPLALILMGLVYSVPQLTRAQEPAAAKQEKKPIAVSVADDNLRFQATGDWKKVEPKSRIVEFEIQVPRIEGDAQDGRLTIMGAGGSLEANIDRWKQQFEAPSEGSIDDATKVSQLKVDAPAKVTMVDISGTFIDSMGGGPFAGGTKVPRKNYRMLAAIIQTEQDGNYFVKLYGPKPTIDKNAKHFESLIKSVEIAR